jgi:hypothetical protein
MSLDFWNNPIVVSAFRIQYRRGGMNTPAYYVLLLAAGGAALHYYRHRIGGSWPHNYFLSLMGLQFFVSGLRAVTATSASIKAEVTNRTLDFQRIAALSPRQILLGKLFGEPAQAYLLAIASIPLAVFCYLWGGVSMDSLVFMYVQLATTTLMLGAMGLLNRLDAVGRRGRGGPEVLVFLFVTLFVVASPMVLMAGRAVLANPWAAGVVGLLTPLPSIAGVIQGDPWLYGLPFFTIEIPFLLVTPISQVLITFLCFHIVERQLVNPLNPSISRGVAYGILVLLDVLTGGMLTYPNSLAPTLATRVAIFWLLHLVFSLGLMLAVTPWRETLISWVWRFRNQRSRLLDLWLGNRSENILALLTFGALGLLNGLLFVVLPAMRMDDASTIAGSWDVPIWVTVTALVLTMTYGTIHQWVIYVAGRSGNGLTLTAIALAIVVPHLVGLYYDLQSLASLSPSYHFGKWLSAAPSNPAAMLAIHGLALVLVWSSLRWRLRRMGEIVDKKLRWMGALDPIKTAR